MLDYNLPGGIISIIKRFYRAHRQNVRIYSFENNLRNNEVLAEAATQPNLNRWY